MQPPHHSLIVTSLILVLVVAVAAPIGSRIDIRQHKDSSIGYVIRSEPEGLHDRVYDGLEIQKYNKVAISVGATPLITRSSHILITNLKFNFNFNFNFNFQKH
jgi:hypothetical protein